LTYLDFKKVTRFLQTTKYLKFFQIIYRFKFFFKFEFKFVELVLNLREQKNWIAHKNKRSSQIMDGELILLNSVGKINSWKPKNKSLLWKYHLHYFDYASDKLSQRESELVSLTINDWVDSNKSTKEFSWDPYPLSLRIVNWIKFHINESKLSDKAVKSLSNQAQYLYKNLEFHLYGNHLFRNAKALCFVGAFFDTKESKKWLSKGIKILKNELKEQLLEDGGNFELSPMYHCNMTEDILDLINLFKAYPNLIDEELNKSLNESIKKMIFWLEEMCHPDGEVSFFNDSVLKNALTLNQLKDYAKLLSVDLMASEKIINKIVHLEHSGYATFQSNEFKLICDIGKIGPNYIPGHGHADILSFELSVFGKRIFVNSGTSLYEESLKRLNQRETNAHNTVEIDEKSSSDVWRSFRVGKRAWPINVYVGKRNISATHNGYSRLGNNLNHKRNWEINQNKIEIIDLITGNFKTAKAYFHIQPDLMIDQDHENELKIYPTNQDFFLKFLASEPISLLDSIWYPEFGKEVPNKVICIPFKSSSLNTIIQVS